MKRVFAIGDIHGCSKTFRKLLLDEIGIQTSDEVYCIGDYIDRGPDSKGVIDLILFLRSQGYTIHTLRGNHEQMMLNAHNDKAKFEYWQNNGADATMKSFGINSLQELNTDYVNFLTQTAYYFELPGYILVHAGLNFKNDDLFKDKEAMLWIRDFEIDGALLNGRIIVHGHTPKPYDFIINQLNAPGSYSINIDGGCVYKYRPGFGNLFALSLHDKKLIAVRNID